MSLQDVLWGQALKDGPSKLPGLGWALNLKTSILTKEEKGRRHRGQVQAVVEAECTDAVTGLRTASSPQGRGDTCSGAALTASKRKQPW